MNTFFVLLFLTICLANSMMALGIKRQTSFKSVAAAALLCSVEAHLGVDLPRDRSMSELSCASSTTSGGREIHSLVRLSPLQEQLKRQLRDAQEKVRELEVEKGRLKDDKQGLLHRLDVQAKVLASAHNRVNEAQHLNRKFQEVHDKLQQAEAKLQEVDNYQMRMRSMQRQLDRAYSQNKLEKEDKEEVISESMRLTEELRKYMRDRKELLLWKDEAEALMIQDEQDILGLYGELEVVKRQAIALQETLARAEVGRNFEHQALMYQLEQQRCKHENILKQYKKNSLVGAAVGMVVAAGCTTLGFILGKKWLHRQDKKPLKLQPPCEKTDLAYNVGT